MSSFQAIFLALQCTINLIALFAYRVNGRYFKNQDAHDYTVVGLTIINIVLDALIIFGGDNG